MIYWFLLLVLLSILFCCIFYLCRKPPNIHIFIFCYNEQVLLPHTIAHYKSHLPSSKITIFDNESTDDSIKIAKKLGCEVVSFSTKNGHDEFKLTDFRNNYWKKVPKGWILMVDIDEWLCVTEKDLKRESKRGTSILKVKGLNMIGQSKKADCSDIDLHSLNRYVEEPMEDKHLCFLREKIQEMNYTLGAHQSNPVGDVVYSESIYYNKHMALLGVPFLTAKFLARYRRVKHMRETYNISTHYTNEIKKIEDLYWTKFKKSKLL